MERRDLKTVREVAMHRLQWWQGTYAEARMSLVYAEECKAETQVREVKQSKYAKEECSTGPNAESPSKKNHEFGKRRSFLGLEESRMTGRLGKNREKGQQLENGLKRIFW